MVRCNESRHHLYKVEDFTIIAPTLVDATMSWLASLETGGEVRLPLLILRVQDLSDPKNTKLMTITNALLRRDRERERCGLPPYWQEIAQHLDDNRSHYIRRVVEEAYKEDIYNGTI